MLFRCWFRKVAGAWRGLITFLATRRRLREYSLHAMHNSVCFDNHKIHVSRVVDYDMRK